MEQSAGAKISALRKEHGLTQAQLAEQMGVTDKAVSKWERDLSFPDIASLPRLAEVLEVPVEQLIPGGKSKPAKSPGAQKLFCLVLRAVPLAMGIAVTLLAALGELDPQTGLVLLGLGLTSAALYLMQEQH